VALTRSTHLSVLPISCSDCLSVLGTSVRPRNVRPLSGQSVRCPASHCSKFVRLTVLEIFYSSALVVVLFTTGPKNLGAAKSLGCDSFDRFCILLRRHYPEFRSPNPHRYRLSLRGHILHNWHQCTVRTEEPTRNLHNCLRDSADCEDWGLHGLGENEF